MKTKDLILHCYLKRTQSHQWVAVCVDLCLASQADTQNEARKKLDAQIRTYVEEALTIDRDHAVALLTRKAPVEQRIEYQVIRLLMLLRLFGNKIGQAFKTTLPVHVSGNRYCPA